MYTEGLQKMTNITFHNLIKAQEIELIIRKHSYFSQGGTVKLIQRRLDKACKEIADLVAVRQAAKKQ